MSHAKGTEESPLSLSANVPPYRLAQPFLREALSATAADPDLEALCGYSPTGGDQVAREAVALWLHQSSALVDIGAEELILCSGVMSALHLVLNHLHRPGEAVLCESATFFGIRDVARQLGLRLVPVSMDCDGVTSEALEAAALSSGARSVVLIPTLQNPTALTYPRERREAIARSCSQLGLAIIEDDIYGALTWPEQPLPAFQVLAPERTFYLGGVSKILLPGLRVGWICCPPQHREPLRELIWTTSIGSPQIGHRLFAQMVMADQAGRLAAIVREEIRGRSRLTIDRLGDWLAPDSPPMSLHYWIPCPMGQARRIHADALAHGLTLTPPELLVIDADNISGIRICIGAPSTRQRLEAALELLADALEQPGSASEQPVV